MAYILANQVDVLINRHGHKAAVEDLVRVVVQDNTLCVVILWCQESVLYCKLLVEVEPKRDFDGLTIHSGS